MSAKRDDFGIIHVKPAESWRWIDAFAERIFLSLINDISLKQ
jgi:hypothetical protein